MIKTTLTIFILTFLALSEAYALNLGQPQFTKVAGGLCDDLPIHGRHEVRLNWEESETSLDTFYNLERTSANTYVVEINPQFRLDENRNELKITKTWSDAQANKYYRNFMRSCFAKYQDLFQDSGGRKIKFRLVDNAEFSQPIVIRGDVHRANTELLSEAPSCATIFHESFHYLGLVDEYEEHEKRYSCRSLGPLTSIMNLPETTYIAPIWNQFLSTINEETPKISLLFPAQVDAIIYPNCMKKNKTYITCASNAYRSINTGPEEKRGCYHVPAVCHTKKWLAKNPS